MTTATAVRTWSIDPVHSSVEFAIRHLMVSTVKGHFRRVEGKIDADETSPLGSSVTATIEVASVDTGNEQRDADLRSPRFFDAETFPTITFASKRVERAGADRYRVVGDLTIRDVTKEVVLDTAFEGQGPDPWGNTRAGFSATVEISRADFGVSVNDVLETGGLVISDAVKVTLNIEAVLAA